MCVHSSLHPSHLPASSCNMNGSALQIVVVLESLERRARTASNHIEVSIQVHKQTSRASFVGCRLFHRHRSDALERCCYRGTVQFVSPRCLGPETALQVAVMGMGTGQRHQHKTDVYKDTKSQRCNHKHGHCHGHTQKHEHWNTDVNFDKYVNINETITRNTPLMIAITLEHFTSHVSFSMRSFNRNTEQTWVDHGARRISGSFRCANRGCRDLVARQRETLTFSIA